MKFSFGTWIINGFGFALVLCSLSAVAFARSTAPEMDPGLVTSGMALLAGGLLLVGGRKRSR